MINWNKLQELIEKQYIAVQKHPSSGLYIYNYTQKAQYEEYWPSEVLMCRGLIVDEQKNIIARPLVKFFNLEQVTNLQLPKQDFEVYEKLDGSLGILYWIGDKPYIATRGSFTSDQANYANNILLPRYENYIRNFDTSFTYLFEIIYPQNRIVVDYKGVDRLVLLAAVNIKDGQEKDIQEIIYPDKAKKYDIGNLEDLQKYISSIENSEKKSESQMIEEGYILKWPNNYRVKVKFEEYKRLHRILTGVSSKTIWQYLSTNQDINELIEAVPDEFYNWVKKTIADLEDKFNNIENECQIYIDNIFQDQENNILNSRKDVAMRIGSHKYRVILFQMYDKKDYRKVIWKILEPAYQKPFASDE
jgi:RNA ligase